MRRRKTFSNATKNFTRFYDFVLGVMIANCSAPISTREQGGLIGARLGAGTGAIIGSTVGHAGVGALIGGPIGLIAGALIGDQLMAGEKATSSGCPE